MPVAWDPVLSETVSYEVETYISNRIVFNELDANAACTAALQNMNTKLLKKIRRLCGAEWILPFSLEVREEYRCFGVASRVLFVAAAHGDCSDDCLSGCVVTGPVPDVLRISDIFEACDSNGRLALLRLPPETATVLQVAMRRAHHTHAHTLSGGVVDDDVAVADITACKLPSGRAFSCFC